MLKTLKLATNLVTNVAGQTLNVVNAGLGGANCLTNLAGNLVQDTIQDIKGSNETSNKTPLNNSQKSFKQKDELPYEGNQINAVSEYELHSGGAYGADTEFGIVAMEYGIEPENQSHWYIGETSDWNAPNGNIQVTSEDREQGTTKMAEAANYLYGYPYKRLKDPRLIRNWCQIKYADTIFAVGEVYQAGNRAFPNQKQDTRLLTNDCVVGGTGYAVARAILDNKPVYVFAQNYNCWCYFNYGTREWEVCEEIPKLTKKFAGIGTRNLTEQGKQAIRDLFAHTFNK